MNSWYKNAFGRNSQNWPLTTLEYWVGTHASHADALEWTDAP
ncbi:hypothetical protein ACFFX0_03310 [Citricoccus parietis]|uniref:Uncharacterized protein n=1 Tax=Citricoccus parietis TaxID=592307 RepID=A0ABV5FUD4_9MICC